MDEPVSRVGLAQMSLKNLQKTLPWGAHNYTDEFNARRDAVRDFDHAHGHAGRALANVWTAVVDEYAHTGNIDRERALKMIADVFICGIRMANTIPGAPVDLPSAIDARLAEKFPDLPPPRPITKWAVWTADYPEDGWSLVEACSKDEAISTLNRESGLSIEEGYDAARELLPMETEDLWGWQEMAASWASDRAPEFLNEGDSTTPLLTLARRLEKLSNVVGKRDRRSSPLSDDVRKEASELLLAAMVVFGELGATPQRLANIIPDDTAEVAALLPPTEPSAESSP